MRRAHLLAAAFVALAALQASGCGQKGPLYLPEKGHAAVTSPTEAPAPAPVPPGQPSPSSPAPEPQSNPQSSPAATAPPAKKSDTDEDQSPK